MGGSKNYPDIKESHPLVSHNHCKKCWNEYCRRRIKVYRDKLKMKVKTQAPIIDITPSGMRKCSVCDISKELIHYHNRRGRISARCKNCVSARRRLSAEGILNPSLAQIKELSAKIEVIEYQPEKSGGWTPSTSRVLCVYCGKWFNDTEWRDRHLDNEHQNVSELLGGPSLERGPSAISEHHPVCQSATETKENAF